MSINLSNEDHRRLNNEEFKEAFQTNVTQTTQEYLSGIGQDYLDKYNYVDQVCADLQSKGITVVIYATLPSPGGYEDSESFYHFHNWYGSQEFENGKATKESMLKISRLNHMLIQAFMNWFMQYVCRNQTFNTVLNSLAGIYVGALGWWRSGKIPEYVQKELDKVA